MKKSQHFKTETLERIAYIVAIVGFPLLLLSTIGVFYQLTEIKRIASSQNNIALSTMFLRDANAGIINAIKKKGGEILIEHGGQYTTTQLDNYLGDFETIDQVYREGLLTEDELCTSFSYYVTATTKNEKVQKYLIENPEFFSGLKHLEAMVKNSTNKNCR